MLTHAHATVDRRMAPQDAHVLIPRTYESVTLHGKKDFRDVIKPRILSGRVVVIRVLVRERGREEKQTDGRCDDRSRSWSDAF